MRKYQKDTCLEKNLEITQFKGTNLIVQHRHSYFEVSCICKLSQRRRKLHSRAWITNFELHSSQGLSQGPPEAITHNRMSLEIQGHKGQVRGHQRPDLGGRQIIRALPHGNECLQLLLQMNLYPLEDFYIECGMLKGVLHPNQKLACFLLYLNIINTFFFAKNNAFILK